MDGNLPRRVLNIWGQSFPPISPQVLGLEPKDLGLPSTSINPELPAQTLLNVLIENENLNFEMKFQDDIFSLHIKISNICANRFVRQQEHRFVSSLLHKAEELKERSVSMTFKFKFYFSSGLEWYCYESSRHILTLSNVLWTIEIRVFSYHLVGLHTQFRYLGRTEEKTHLQEFLCPQRNGFQTLRLWERILVFETASKFLSFGLKLNQ